MPLVVVSRIAQLEPPHADPSVASAADIPGDSRQPSFFGRANGSFERASQRNFFDLRAIETRGARLCTQYGEITASRFPRSIGIGRWHCECNPRCKAGFGSRLRRNEKAPIPRSFLKLAERVADLTLSQSLRESRNLGVSTPETPHPYHRVSRNPDPKHGANCGHY